MDNVSLVINGEVLSLSDVYVNGRKFVPAESNPFGSQIALAGCKHLHLSKAGSIYRCGECHNLFDVTLGEVVLGAVRGFRR